MKQRTTALALLATLLMVGSVTTAHATPKTPTTAAKKSDAPVQMSLFGDDEEEIIRD